MLPKNPVKHLWKRRFHPQKLTCHLKRNRFNKRFQLLTGIVSFQGGWKLEVVWNPVSWGYNLHDHAYWSISPLLSETGPGGRHEPAKKNMKNRSAHVVIVRVIMEGHTRLNLKYQWNIDCGKLLPHNIKHKPCTFYFFTRVLETYFENPNQDIGNKVPMMFFSLKGMVLSRPTVQKSIKRLLPDRGRKAPPPAVEKIPP